MSDQSNAVRRMMRKFINGERIKIGLSDAKLVIAVVGVVVGRASQRRLNLLLRRARQEEDEETKKVAYAMIIQ